MRAAPGRHAAAESLSAIAFVATCLLAAPFAFAVDSMPAGGNDGFDRDLPLEPSPPATAGGFGGNRPIDRLPPAGDDVGGYPHRDPMPLPSGGRFDRGMPLEPEAPRAGSDFDRDLTRDCLGQCRDVHTDCTLGCESMPIGERDDCLIACDESRADCALDCRERY